MTEAEFLGPNTVVPAMLFAGPLIIGFVIGAFTSAAAILFSQKMRKNG